MAKIKIKVTRILVYEGEEGWVRDALNAQNALVQIGQPFVSPNGTITEIFRKETKDVECETGC